MTPVPLPVGSTEARPIDAGERLVLLDTLRGFALCGVFISNVFMWFSGRAFLPKEQMDALLANMSLLDKLLLPTVTVLVFGRFITIFSFLFGLGFAVQLGRAEARGGQVGGVYSRRLGVMFLLGLCHLFLIWYGDILTNYALLGFGLLLFRKRTDRTLLVWAAVFVFVWPLLGQLVLKLPQLLADTPEAAAAIAKAETDRVYASKAVTLAAFQHGSWLEVVRGAATFYLKDFLPMIGIGAFAIFGRFLLGLYAGRRRLFHDAAQHLGFFRKLLAWGVGLGLVGSSASVVLQQLIIRKVLNPETLPPWVGLVMSPLRNLGELGVAAAYVSAITLLFHRAAWQRVLTVLAPVGRMALTNYLSQSVISVFVFYGFGLGLITRLSPIVCILYCLGVFAVQGVFSHLWLSRFRFGPAEWLWRSLTYGKAQPMRRAPEAGVPVPAS
ncbi:DUF418 domain-containing protein [Myxococcus sp. K15C18031901]|uniref:DUF418 domain-containing protein n=1 Tax=Myxococcus dinghuensis TaxID=2906761 RepID=UPI0020A768F1|nr:DUF418 domain-containing protein [Myxococcus dinghuensis]MCP3102800.1 DUF418 domain-containing protein [Myxococcus dinghuensis]